MESTFARRRVGAYEITSELARGGMAIVHLARQPALDRDVALKELATFPFAQASLAERFLRESRVSGSLRNEHIVQVYDYIEQDGVAFIAMEYLERGSLRPHMAHLTLPQAAGVLEGVLAGLAHAHTHNIVHRDLKPENVLVTTDGSVKIADFGIAKAISSVSPGLTATGTTVGTPCYMAPEQAQAKTIGPWTDLYAVGVMAFEMLTGRVPYDDQNEPWAVLLQHINDPLPSPLALNPALDPGIAAWLERMLAKEPAHRPASARDAWDQLDDHVVRAAGPFWRREARLDERLDGEHDESHSRPLSEAQFPSAADLAFSPQAGYLTFNDGPPRTPTPPIAPPPPVSPPPMPVSPATPSFAITAPPPPSPPPVTPPLPVSPPVVTGGSLVAPNPDWVTVPPRNPVEPAQTQPPRRRGRRVIAAVATVLLLAGSGIAGLLALQSAAPNPPPQPLLSMKSVEAAVRESLPANDVSTVRCPPGTPRRPGLAVECKAVLDGGDEMAVTVRQTADGVTAHPHL